jgi:hypothetical protein
MIVRASRQKDPNGTIKDVKDVFEGKRTPGSFFEFADDRLEKMYAAASAANPSWSMDTWLGQRSIVSQFREFAGPDLIWSQLDSALLRSWDAAMVKKGNKSGTRNTKLSVIRSTVSTAVRDKVINSAESPFNDFQMPPTTKSKKRSLDKIDIQKLALLELPPASDDHTLESLQDDQRPILQVQDHVLAEGGHEVWVIFQLPPSQLQFAGRTSTKEVA